MIDYSLALDFSDHESLVIGILSDTHGSLDVSVAEVIRDCDIALHAGDIMGAASLRALEPRMGLTYAVKGNNDAYTTWAPEDHAMLDDIPDLLELNLPGGKLIMEHSHRFWNPDFDKLRRTLRQEHTDADLIVYGHTHVRCVDESQHPIVVNPGAAGAVRVHDGPSCLVLTVSEESWNLSEHQFEA